MWWLIAILSAMSISPKPPRRPSTGRSPSPVVRAAIVNAAQRHGVPIGLLMAFADLESGFNPLAEGDSGWVKRSNNYLANVLGNKRISSNPYRGDPTLWHSYGLFQLLAPYHTGPTEDPRRLLDPHVNADRAAAAIRRYLDASGNDPWRARMRFVGLTDSSPNLATARDRFVTAAKKWGVS